MLLTRVKEAYYRGVQRLNISNRDDAWPVILRTDGIYLVKPYYSIPTKDGYQSSNEKVSWVKVADLSPEFDIRFCPEVPMAKTTINAIRDGVMQYLGKHKLLNVVEEENRYYVSHNGETGVIAKRVPEGDKFTWVEVEAVTFLGVPHFIGADNVYKSTVVGREGVTPCNSEASTLTPDSIWVFADQETKSCLFSLAKLNETGQVVPTAVRTGDCKCLGTHARDLMVSVIYSAEKHEATLAIYPKLSLVAPLAEGSDLAEEIGFLCVGITPPYRGNLSVAEGTGESIYEYVPTSETILDIKDVAKLVGGRVWISSSHLSNLKKREQADKPTLKPRTVLQTQVLSTTGHMLNIRVLTTENELEMGVYQYRESSNGGYTINPDDYYQIGKLVAKDVNSHDLSYVPLCAIVPDLERLSLALSRPVIMLDEVRAANESMAWRSGRFDSMARNQGYGINHGGLGSWMNETPRPGYGYDIDRFNHGTPRGYDNHYSQIAAVSVPNSFYSEVEIPSAHTTCKVRFLGNTASHLAKAVLTNPGDVFVLDGHAWKPLTEDCTQIIDAILSTVGHAIPVEGFMDTWVSGVVVNVSFFGNTRRTTINITESDGFVRQVALTTRASAFVDIKKYL